MTNKLFAQYQALERTYKAIEKERKELREAIVANMIKDGVEKKETEFGNFTVAHKTVWGYTLAIIKMLEKVKVAQAKEQQKGTAIKSVTDYLVYNEVN